MSMKYTIAVISIISKYIKISNDKLLLQRLVVNKPKNIALQIILKNLAIIIRFVIAVLYINIIIIFSIILSLILINYIIKRHQKLDGLMVIYPINILL